MSCNIYFILFLVVSAIVAIIFLFDFIPQFHTWQGRIHIGRYADRETWAKKILAKSKSWLAKTPTIKLTDNERLIVFDIILGNYSRNAIQHWQQASLVLGLTECVYKTNDESQKSQITNFVQSKLDDSGNWKNTPKEIDGVILAYSFLNVDWLDHKKYKPAYDAMWKMVREMVGDDGTIQYRTNMKSYRYVDTIGFVCPFLMAYGIRFNNNEAIDLCVKQIAEFNKYGMLNGEFIPCHTYHTETKLPVGLFGWGRGLGWYAIGLIDAWKILPDNHPQKNQLTESVVSFAKTAIKWQQEYGAWTWIVTRKESRADSSATATLAWCLGQASSIKDISKSCLEAKEKALKYLMTVTRRDGIVDFSQGDTKDIGVHSQHFDILPFTQGFVLRTVYDHNL
ncbi:MAG TPA: glycoside hydrolase family 88 protein [Flavobacterium sp.]|nr:glycoside hydrolase family 88 protein [Flavobacterium sp.]